MTVREGTVVSNPNITLDLTYTANATHMAISNTADFIGYSFEAPTSTKAWLLPSGSGTKTIYVRFRESNGCTIEKKC